VPLPVRAPLPQSRRFSAVQRVMGVLLMVFSITMLPPIGVSLYFEDGSSRAFLIGLAATFITGALVWYPVRDCRAELKIRDGFLVTALFWIVLGLFGAVPLYAVERPDLSLSQAAFEAISGLTTTGATVIVGLDQLPASVLYYRQQLQWFGGMGLVILAIAILPMLGVGGMQLYRAEALGPVKDTKLTPRLVETARALWLIYLGLTVACAAAYRYAGMGWFDAIGHAYSTVANGGFSTKDASIGHFQNPLIESICLVFMIIAATNFALHFLAFRTLSLRGYVADAEFRLFVGIIAAASLAVSLLLLLEGTYSGGEVVLKALFQVVSIGTTAGFTSADLSLWPMAVPPLMMLMSFIGGCAYSTGGGIKVVRIMLLFKQGIRSVFQNIHPSAVAPVKLGTRTVPDEVIQGVWGFFSVYMGFYVILLVLMLLSGLDPLTAFGSVAATINNLGPGLGETASNFAGINSLALWVGTFGMLLGRLELFPLLVLMTPYFWHR
jgi:trk system potassium uptake protein TrkH